MKQQVQPHWRRKVAVAATAAAVASLVSGIAHAVPTFEGDDYKVDVYYENHTVYRGADATGKTVGLAKFRNTLQVEADKTLNDGWALHSVLRGSFDGVYRMNDEEFGDKAGGAITLQNNAGSAAFAATLPVGAPGIGTPASPAGFGSPADYLTWVQLNNPTAQLTNNNRVAYGYGLGSMNYGGYYISGSNNGAPGLPPAAAWTTATPNQGYLGFGFNLATNRNEGLRVLGDRWHGLDGGVAFAAPVRPCDVDSRGCADFGGYGNLTRHQLEMPEFAHNGDFLREIFVKKTFTLSDGTDLFVKVGRQQIVWGRTDLFRVLDVFNPVDYSRNNIYDELQDIRIPLWSAQVEWRFGGGDWLQERNLQFVWSFDKFRANNLGQCGSPNAILDTGCFFRGMKNLWDNGGTVANFASGAFATDFAPHVIGIRDVLLPNWSESGTYGVKFEGVTKEGVSFSLNALSYRSQLPSLHGGRGIVDPFWPAPGSAATPTLSSVPYLIAFDMHFPRINLVGGSMDFQSEELGAAFRIEAAFTDGEEFANTSRPELYSKNRVFRSVIGVDRPTFVPFINETRTTLFSGQLFFQHIFDHELKNGLSGPGTIVGMPDWENNVIGTLLIKGFLAGDRVSPQLIMARDFKAKAYVMSPQVEWNVTDDLKLTFGGNFKGGGEFGGGDYRFDDCRDCRPFGTLGSAGPWGTLSGIEPLGRFRAGPIGAAVRENDLYFQLKYKF